MADGGGAAPHVFVARVQHRQSGRQGLAGVVLTQNVLLVTEDMELEVRA